MSIHERWKQAEATRRQIDGRFGADSIMADRARRAETYWRDFYYVLLPVDKEMAVPADKLKEMLEADETEMRKHQEIER